MCDPDNEHQPLKSKSLSELLIRQKLAAWVQSIQITNTNTYGDRLAGESPSSGESSITER
jgi:hypothetical protein